MVDYMTETKKKVEEFLRKKGSALQTEAQYLGSKTMKIRYSTIKAILSDLEKEKKIRIVKFKVGSSVFTKIEWRMGWKPK